MAKEKNKCLHLGVVVSITDSFFVTDKGEKGFCKENFKMGDSMFLNTKTKNCFVGNDKKDDKSKSESKKDTNKQDDTKSNKNKKDNAQEQEVIPQEQEEKNLLDTEEHNG